MKFAIDVRLDGERIWATAPLPLLPRTAERLRELFFRKGFTYDNNWEIIQQSSNRSVCKYGDGLCMCIYGKR